MHVTAHHCKTNGFKVNMSLAMDNYFLNCSKIHQTARTYWGNIYSDCLKGRKRTWGSFYLWLQTFSKLMFSCIVYQQDLPKDFLCDLVRTYKVHCIAGSWIKRSQKEDYDRIGRVQVLTGKQPVKMFPFSSTVDEYGLF